MIQEVFLDYLQFSRDLCEKAGLCYHQHMMDVCVLINAYHHIMGLSKYRKDTQTTQRHTKTRKDGQRRAKTRKDTQRHAKAAKKRLKLTKTHKDGQRHAKICVSLHVFVCLCVSLRVFARLCVSLRSLGVFVVFR